MDDAKETLSSISPIERCSKCNDNYYDNKKHYSSGFSSEKFYLDSAKRSSAKNFSWIIQFFQSSFEKLSVDFSKESVLEVLPSGIALRLLQLFFVLQTICRNSFKNIPDFFSKFLQKKNKENSVLIFWSGNSKVIWRNRSKNVI